MVKQYEIYWVSFDPTQGREIKKTRPCLIISPIESNAHLQTVLIAPITSTIRNFPMRMNIIVKGKKGQVAIDQIRCVDKTRLGQKMDQLRKNETNEFKERLKEYLLD
jgi:mRNA interferase MazF